MNAYDMRKLLERQRDRSGWQHDTPFDNGWQAALDAVADRLPSGDVGNVAALVRMARQLLRAPNVVTAGGLEAALASFEDVPGEGLMAPLSEPPTPAAEFSEAELVLKRLHDMGFEGKLAEAVQQALDRLDAMENSAWERSERD